MVYWDALKKNYQQQYIDTKASKIQVACVA